MNFKDTSSHEWDRQLTPPDSPLPPIRTIIGRNRHLETSSGKMSLAFIAPGSGSTHCPLRSPSQPGLRCTDMIQRQSRTPSPAYSSGNSQSWLGSNKGYSPTTSLPSPVWSSFSESIPHHQPHTIHRPTIYNSQSHSHTRPEIKISRSYVMPPNKHQRPKVSKASTGPVRAERHTYDPEERYAIIHLRALAGLKWDDVLTRFHDLFPPGQQRRHTSSPLFSGLPAEYQIRNVQGLQCRWYRIREEEGLEPLRRGEMCGGKGEGERAVLQGMVRRGAVSGVFLKRL